MTTSIIQAAFSIFYRFLTGLNQKYTPAAEPPWRRSQGAK